MSGRFGLLNTVALHHLAVPVDADIPRPSRLALAVQHRGVRHVVILKHALFEFTLWVEVLLSKEDTNMLTRSFIRMKNSYNIDWLGCIFGE